MSEETSTWLSKERAKLASAGVVEVKQSHPYVSFIAPRSHCVLSESYFYGSSSELSPSEIESRVIEGFRNKPELLREISKVFIYFNQDPCLSQEGSMRYFIYAGKFQPVEFVADPNPFLALNILESTNLDSIFQHHYHVNFSHNWQNSKSSLKHKYETRELSLSKPRPRPMIISGLVSAVRSVVGTFR